MRVQLLCDNLNSWMYQYIHLMAFGLGKYADEVLIRSHTDQVTEGDVLVLLSCEGIFKKLHLNKYNLVVHESDLPKGRGWSPLTWQVLEGKNEIVICLFEAAEKVDSGIIYEKATIHLDGTELIDELRRKQADATYHLLEAFLRKYPNVNGAPQKGEPSYYPRRKPEDSRLDPEKTIAEQFGLLRVCDNMRYPSYFYYRGKKFILKIEQSDENK